MQRRPITPDLLSPPEPEDFTPRYRREDRGYVVTVAWEGDSAEACDGKAYTTETIAERQYQNWIKTYRKADVHGRRKMLGWRPLTPAERMLF